VLPRDSGTLVKRRLDYRPPAFLIPSIHLEVELDPAVTRVRSVIEFRRNPDAAPEDRASALILDGEQQDEVSIELDGAPVSSEAFTLTERSLTVRTVPDAGRLTIRSLLAPAKNHALEGLYLSSGVFCTQCEPEGFRRITYFADRPDVLTQYTVTLRADRLAYPVLLSNGNLVSQGSLPDGRHFATWHDPFPKPSYLFAMVAGDLAANRSTFMTMSGRTVSCITWRRKR